MGYGDPLSSESFETPGCNVQQVGFSVTFQQLISFKIGIKAVKGFCQMGFAYSWGFGSCVSKAIHSSQGYEFFFFFPVRNEDKVPAGISREGLLFIHGSVQAGTAARWMTFSHFPANFLFNHPRLMAWSTSALMQRAPLCNLLFKGQRESLRLESDII